MPEGVKAVLLDIEGTTTSLSYVHDVLYPYAGRRMREACGRASSDPRIAEAVRLLRLDYETEAGRGDATLPPFENGASFALWLMERDRKATGLKALQGLIWEAGYKEGRLKAHLFEDVPGALEAWKEAGVRVRIFSSGSVLAQRLLFSHTEWGDLSRFIEGYHDRRTGPKREAASYREIARQFGLEPAQVLFLSDVRGELDAARQAGMATGMTVRPGNGPQDPGPHPVRSSLLGSL